MASRSRISLQKRFEEILGSSNVYFQPPESVKMNYPCIRYSLKDMPTVKASNKKYAIHKCYSVTLICKDPDNTIKDTLLTDFDYMEFVDHYRADNLNHYVYTLYY